MDIVRSGALRNRGETDIIRSLPFTVGGKYEWQNNVRWDQRLKRIVISAPFIPHPDGQTHHDYRIYLSLDDVAAIITMVGHAGSADDASLLRKTLKDKIPEIVRLLACATGLVPTPMAEVKGITEAKKGVSVT